MTYTISQFRRDIREPYAWPGGYPRFFITSDGAALSFEAARDNRRNILEAIRDNLRDGWQIVACEVNWEDCSLYCDQSGKPIPSAYGTE